MAFEAISELGRHVREIMRRLRSRLALRVAMEAEFGDVTLLPFSAKEKACELCWEPVIFALQLLRPS